MEKTFINDPTDGVHQPFTLGVALSGGGARGFAHAGALQAIDEAGLKIDMIAGVSAGAIIAVLYAAGIKPQTILQMFIEGKFYDFANFSIGKGGLMRIDKIIQYITRSLGKIKNLEDLKIPTYIGVTNFDEGRPEIFSKGEIGPIVQASCSIPLAILPVEINGVDYVDGGVLRNLPAWAIREQCDYLIGINVSPLLPKKSEHNLLSIALRTYSLLAKSNLQQDIDLCDTIVTVDSVAKHKTFSLKEIQKVYDDGYNKMREALDHI